MVRGPMAEIYCRVITGMPAYVPGIVMWAVFMLRWWKSAIDIDKKSAILLAVRSASLPI
jgi:hypothetical protein